MTTRPRLLFSAFTEYTVSQHDHGLWARPDSRQSELNDVDYWLDQARLLERARFDFFFFADILGPYTRYGGNHRAAVKSGLQFPINDPAVLIPVLANRTEHLGFIHTQNTIQEHPYSFARKLATLDHVTRGRVGWNIVTTEVQSTGKIYGLGGLPSRQDRYRLTEEFLDAVLKLWEGSWEDDALQVNKASQIYSDPDKVHSIAHHGRHFEFDAPLTVSPSPQRTPFLAQATASSYGLGFAGRHAELVITRLTRENAADRIGRLQASARAAGREPADIKLMADFSFVLGSTESEAQRLYREYVDGQILESILVKYSEFWQIDLSRVSLQAKVVDLLNRHQADTHFIEALKASPDLDWRFERFARWYANRKVVGTPEQLVQAIEGWQDLGVHGINVYYTVSPTSFVDFVDHVAPLLQARGLLQREYRTGTLREKVFGQGPTLPDRHPARQVRQTWSAA